MSRIRVVSAAELGRLRAEYDRTHWCEGCAPPSTRPGFRAPDPRLPLVELGTLFSVTYLAEKGGEFAAWEHEFSRGKRPVLAYNRTGIVVAGGHYTVTARGIEG